MEGCRREDGRTGQPGGGGGWHPAATPRLRARIRDHGPARTETNRPHPYREPRVRELPLLEPEPHHPIRRARRAAEAGSGWRQTRDDPARRAVRLRPGCATGHGQPAGGHLTLHPRPGGRQTGDSHRHHQRPHPHPRHARERRKAARPTRQRHGGADGELAGLLDTTRGEQGRQGGEAAAAARPGRGPRHRPQAGRGGLPTDATADPRADERGGKMQV